MYYTYKSFNIDSTQIHLFLNIFTTFFVKQIVILFIQKYNNVMYNIFLMLAFSFNHFHSYTYNNNNICLVGWCMSVCRPYARACVYVLPDWTANGYRGCFTDGWPKSGGRASDTARRGRTSRRRSSPQTRVQF